MLPLLESDMPFDDIRRVTAILQRAETEHLEVLNSVWVKARVQVHELNDFLARPQGIIMQALQQMPVTPDLLDSMPRMRNLDGLSELLRRLRNSGLKPRLSGDGLPRVDTSLSERTAAE